MKSDPECSPSTGEPLVSVIIPVRDDPKGIVKVLECLDAQTLPNSQFEVVIGDDGSRPDRVPGVPGSDSRIRLISGPPLTSYAARNAAARSARGRVLAFCDADCLPEPRWLEEGLAALENADIVAGEVQFHAPENPTVWSLLTIDLFLDQNQNVTLSRAVTANIMVRRIDFEKINGFDQSLPSGGDYDFVRRMVQDGARLEYAPLAVVGHPTMDRASPFLRKIYKTNFWSGARHARNKDQMDLMGILLLVPVIGVVLARHRVYRPAFRLQRQRLKKSNVRTDWRKRALAVAALYCIVYFVAGIGRVFGWLRGLNMNRPEYGPTYGGLSGDKPDGKQDSERPDS